ncbi:MAG: hypothetical protein EOO11_15425 [Chitinophagaceae bacterium]|nr:MAG: hypothetical protein EOO11_15425 [Chitinophagaceae bacterium]
MTETATDANEFRGAFIFEAADHGILYSTYLNTFFPEPYPETARRKPGRAEQDSWTGVYDTVWLENSLSSELSRNSALLTIAPWANGLSRPTSPRTPSARSTMPSFDNASAR